MPAAAAAQMFFCQTNFLHGAPHQLLRMESASLENFHSAPESQPPPPLDSALAPDDEEGQNNPPPPPSDSGSSVSEDNEHEVMISVTAAGRTPHQKKRQTSAVVNIPKHISKKDISHVFRAVADAAPSEQAVVVTAFETEIDHLEDKPWRAEGADPSDWFNYGFNEETWRRYCEKQMRLRREYAMGGNPSIHQMQQPPQPMYPPQHHMQQQHPPFQQQMQAPRYDGPPLRASNVPHHQFMPQPVHPNPPAMTQDRDRRGNAVDSSRFDQPFSHSHYHSGSSSNDPRGFTDRVGERRRRSRSRSREREDSK